MKRLLLIFVAILSLNFAKAQMTIEAEPQDPTLVVRGEEYKIACCDNVAWQETDNQIALFTSKYADCVSSDRRTLVGVAIDSNMKVVEVVNPSQGDGAAPKFDETLNLTIPENGFVVVASDDSYATRGVKRFLAENFRVGDLIKIRVDGEPISITTLYSYSSTSSKPGLKLMGDEMFTTTSKSFELKGQILAFDKASQYVVEVGSEQRGGFSEVEVDNTGAFATKVKLAKGVNYVDVRLISDDNVVTQSKIIYYKNTTDKAKEIVLWVEQFPNAKVLTSQEAVDAMVEKAAEAGFTTIGFDVKGPEGYVSYRKSTLSKSPYFTISNNPNKKVVDDGFDLLEAVIKSSHKHGLKVLSSFNMFTEGNLTSKDIKMLDRFPEWIEQVQHPEDLGNIVSLLDSKRGQRSYNTGSPVVLAFTNPSNTEVQDFQLLRVEEVLKNYDVDGIVLDRCRYDNMYADFSELTKQKFEEYLASKSKKMSNFPSDIFTIDASGSVVEGELFNEWFTFRSMTIKKFTDRVRALVDKYKKEKNSKLIMAAYVGSWYEVYYQNGVNWASKNFRYNDRLKFPNSSIYTDDYYQTSYLDNIDLLMIGTYFKTDKEVNKYITLGNILTNGEVPLLGSMSLPDLQDESRKEVFNASIDNTSGLMIFDLCYINNWNKFIEQIARAREVK